MPGGLGGGGEGPLLPEEGFREEDGTGGGGGGALPGGGFRGAGGSGGRESNMPGGRFSGRNPGLGVTTLPGGGLRGGSGGCTLVLLEMSAPATVSNEGVAASETWRKSGST